MRKLKSCSFYFIAIIFFASGFLFSTAHASTTIDTDIIIDTTWTKDGSPYFVTSEITVAEGATLSLSAGVVVKLNNSLIVDGKIDAEGTVAEPIYFTSINDERGGNTYESCYYENYEEDGITPIGEKTCETITVEGEPRVGDWLDIFIESGAEQSILNNVVMRYSSDGIYQYNGASLSSTNYDSDQGVSVIGSEGSFDNLKATFLYIQNSSNVTLLNSKIKGVDNDVVYIFDNSTAVFENVEISNEESEWPSGTGLYIFGNSSLEISNSNITGVGDGFWVFDNSFLNLLDTSIDCQNDGITLFENSNLNFSGGSVSCLNYGISLHDNVKADISEVKITDALDAGIFAYNNTDLNSITITKSEITGNNYGFLIYSTNFTAHENNIHDNLSNGAITSPPWAPEGETPPVYNLDFINNFWGDASGPIHSTNPDGIGDEVSDGILYSPFLKSDPLIPIIPTKNPVIIVPGIMGTYLYKNYDDNAEIWPNITRVIKSIDDLYLNDLSLNMFGKENPEKPIIPGDIIRSIPSYGMDVFAGLISELENNGGYIEGKDLFVFPYDWRMSTKESADLLKSKIDEVLLNTEQEKVDIVAHSMGGLIAKKYIADNGEDKVDQLIFLGTPHLGSPKAFKTLMFGDSMGFEKYSISFLRPAVAKLISQNMPAVYELLPSEKYVSESGSYVINDLDKKKEPVSLDYNQTKDLMIEKGRTPEMFPFAENLHNGVDNLNLSNVNTYNFVGCGSKTMGEITVKQKRSWKGLFLSLVDDFDLKYINGDETVPLLSAIDVPGAEVHFVKNITHGDLPSADGVKQDILSILKGDPLQSYSNILGDTTNCNISGKVVSTHSPVELHIYDEEGNHTGPNTEGDIEYNIAGVQYDVIDGEKFAFLPDGVNYRIVTDATDIGGYNFQIKDEDKDDNITNTYNWTLIPLKTLNTQGEIWVGPDYSPDEYKVKIDENGDGNIDNNYSVSFDGTKEAEKATGVKISSSGSIPIINNVMETKLIDTVEAKLIASVEKLIPNTDKVNYTSIKQGQKVNNVIVEKAKLDQNVGKLNPQSQRYNSETKVNLLWPVIIIFGFILLILAKIFIKL